METTVNASHLSAAVHRFPSIGYSRQPSRLKRFRSAAPRTRCFDFFEEVELSSIHTVKLSTSNLYGSSLSDTNAGVLVCLIDENGYSILHRLSAYEAEASTIHSNSDNQFCCCPGKWINQWLLHVFESGV